MPPKTQSMFTGVFEDIGTLVDTLGLGVEFGEEMNVPYLMQPREGVKLVTKETYIFGMNDKELPELGIVEELTWTAGTGKRQAAYWEAGIRGSGIESTVLYPVMNTIGERFPRTSLPLQEAVRLNIFIPEPDCTITAEFTGPDSVKWVVKDPFKQEAFAQYKTPLEAVRIGLDLMGRYALAKHWPTLSTDSKLLFENTGKQS
jgi:hypothetical protein